MSKRCECLDQLDLLDVVLGLVKGAVHARSSTNKRVGALLVSGELRNKIKLSRKS